MRSPAPSQQQPIQPSQHAASCSALMSMWAVMCGITCCLMAGACRTCMQCFPRTHLMLGLTGLSSAAPGCRLLAGTLTVRPSGCGGCLMRARSMRGISYPSCLCLFAKAWQQQGQRQLQRHCYSLTLVGWGLSALWLTAIGRLAGHIRRGQALQELHY